MFYQLGALQTWEMTCELFEYSDEQLKTGIPEIDSLQTKFSTNILDFTLKGEDGKYLTTDGTTSSWGTVNALPSQTGNSGKYLTTNGTAASWSTIVTDPTPSIFMLMGA